MMKVGTLFYKECLRFFRVFGQTVLSPAFNSVLYLVVFSQTNAYSSFSWQGWGYVDFLIPGLFIMTMLQTSFMNSSTSLILAKVTGNLHFLLMAPIGPWGFYSAYVLASVFRALIAGLFVLLSSMMFSSITIKEPFYLIGFSLLGSAIMGGLGLTAGIWGRDFDHHAFFNSFVVFPLTFLSAVFFPFSKLPSIFQRFLLANPIFFMVDGVRFGFLGDSDCDPHRGFVVLLVIFVCISIFNYCILASGYRLRE
ncbi:MULTISPECIES: ABC transporter permease [Candidatus Ichthyocystis]|uniref:Transport permease protein n=1 Tax=Candidatus Ichthyocystis hellenicum TaxID=1561003 RepID=A0A0S4M2B8_9BURK|nr:MULTISPECIES: ABC transporter permease [Ichthyocystis]CUT17026.1 ABC-2 type transport system permease protein [Candidatus Ichthyocystis hellenicum]